jgi:gluconate 2-dehydrogenase gamma chain
MSERTRREALITIAGLSGSVCAEAQSQPSFFTAAERDAVTALVDTIIPATDTPGASDAGVPAFIERRVAANAALARRFRAGLELLDTVSNRRFSATFATLAPQQRIELLTPASLDAKSPLGVFFKLSKGLTVDGYYTSKEGLTKELGWHGNTFLKEFQGCTHPEHQS